MASLFSSGVGLEDVQQGGAEAGSLRSCQALNEVKAVLPENLHCLLLCAVTKDNKAKVGILGSDMDIAKMLMTVTTVARNGVVQANSPSNPTNEVPQ